ncbi:MAG: hypothetical protein J1G38_00970 [Clostridiales bacterium]|nr:hypothetical protein [Clostridiales bacterium]
MKKFVKKGAVALALAAALSVGGVLAGCGDPDKKSDPKPKPDPGPALEYVDKSETPYVSSLDGYKKTDWTAKWIWQASSGANTYAAFRKTFTLSSKPEKAIASIAAESKYWLWVNEELVVYDGGPKRGPTPYDTYYENVDLSEYLKQGENLIVALVAYNGRSGNSSVDPGQAGFLFEMNAGGTKVVSDSSFKVMRLREYRNQGLLTSKWPNYPQASMLAEWNVYYDANYSVGEYTKISYDDSEWANATEVGVVGAMPFNDTYLSPTPLIKFDKDYVDLSSEYIGQKLTKDTKITVDLPDRQNIQFSPYFELTADSKDLRITYYTNTYTTQNLNSFKDDYVCAEGKQTYEQYPWRSGSQLIIEAPAGVTFDRIAIRVSGYNSERVGSFVSDNEDLNTLWQKAVNTLLICMRDTYMDCPERERSSYLGDSSNQIGETFYSLDENSYAMTKKLMLTSLGWTKTNNEIPLRSPSMTTNENPGQTLSFLASVWEYYLYTGDAETVRMFYPLAVNYLKLWSLNADGSIQVRNGSFNWVDWGSGYDTTVLQNAFYYYALSSIDKLANALDISTDSAFFTERLQKVKAGFAKFKKDGGYTSGTKYDDRANAMAVVAGLADLTDKAEYDGILNVLKTVKGASPYMEKYVLEALAQMGEYDACLERMLDRYDAMIKDVDSTLWEVWSKTPVDGTMNHGWSGGPLTVLSKYFGGIVPTAKGYDSYEITIGSAFYELEMNVRTPKGDISYELSIEGGAASLKLTAVANGVLRIPLSMGAATISGASSEKLADENGYACYKLAGGNYTVTIA